MPPQLDVASSVGALCVDDSDVGAVCGHRRQLLAGERAHHGGDAGMRREVAAPVAAQHAERQVRRARGVGGRHPGV